jgi:uncharacterized protein (TIGR02001 family)
MHMSMRSVRRALALAAVGAVACAGAALADGVRKSSIKDEAMAPPPSDWAVTYNFAVTTDYVFRGVSQSDQRPAVQAGVDVTYKWFYVGAWGSTIDFDVDENVEVDIYAGIKPVWGPLTFDFGVIYYWYPGSPGALDYDFVELKAGVSGSPWKDGTLGFLAFWTPEGTGKTGEIWTFEGAFAQVLPKLRDITPTFSTTLGYVVGESSNAIFTSLIGDDTYLYWNAGVSFAFHERFSVDFRYWDTNVSGAGTCATLSATQCDERFVATAKVTY